MKRTYTDPVKMPFPWWARPFMSPIQNYIEHDLKALGFHGLADLHNKAEAVRRAEPGRQYAALMYKGKPVIDESMPHYGFEECSRCGGTGLVAKTKCDPCGYHIGGTTYCSQCRPCHIHKKP